MKRAMFILILVLALIILTTIAVLRQKQFGRQPRGERLARIEASPHYRGGQFRNTVPTANFTRDGSKGKVLSDLVLRRRGRLSPEEPLPHIRTNLKTLPPDRDVLVWFGHSSYYLQIGGKKILVDPVLSGYASPFRWMVRAFDGTQVWTPDDIPDIDLLLITHDHWDHLDYKTMVALQPRIAQVVCGLGVGAHLEHWGFDPGVISELDWHENVPLRDGWSLTATPARHFSGRSLKRNTTLWVSFVLETDSLRLFLGGDGGYGPHLEEIGKRFGPFDLAILEQGQYNTNWKQIHLMPDELFRAAQELRTRRVMPVHLGKFTLSTHPWNEPLKHLTANGKKHTISAVTPIIGEVVHLNDTSQQFRKWWD
jgi:L-ascorbate metabolism protein UlaG (beta-lactamase superfamily)